MKNTRVLSILAVAVFALTGCSKTCSKDEFIDLAKKTEEHQYATASAKLKGKVTSSTEGINQTYEPDDTLDFKYQDGNWGLVEDMSSYNSIKQSLVLTCIVILSNNIREIIKNDELFADNDYMKLTCYSSPLGFNVKSDFKDHEEDVLGLKTVMNGKGDTTYNFNNKDGMVIKYVEKSDLTMDLTYSSDLKIKTKTVTDITITFSYSD